MKQLVSVLEESLHVVLAVFNGPNQRKHEYELTLCDRWMDGWKPMSKLRQKFISVSWEAICKKVSKAYSSVR